MTTDDYREVVDKPRDPDPFILAAHVSAQQYTGPRMHVGTVTDREIAAHVDGWAAAWDHLAAQPVAYRAAALALYLRRADYHTPESWDREPGSVKLPYLLDASAALTAAKEATR